MLEVRATKSGRIGFVSVVVADYEAERYWVSMLGQKANWGGTCARTEPWRSGYVVAAKM